MKNRNLPTKSGRLVAVLVASVLAVGGFMIVSSSGASAEVCSNYAESSEIPCCPIECEAAFMGGSAHH